MGFSSVVQCLPNMYKTLGSIHSTKREQFSLLFAEHHEECSALGDAALLLPLSTTSWLGTLILCSANI